MSIPDFSLNGQVALVTGGRRGIGREIALAFAEAGADVAVCDKEVEDGQLEAVAEEIRGFGRRSLAVQVDTSRKLDVDNLVEVVIGELGVIDILVNNAAVVMKAPILDMVEKDWDTLMSVDLKGYYLCSQAVGKRMVERKKGSIINIASVAGFRASKDMGAYNIAKAGIIMLTRVLALNLGPYNIRANAIAPGLVKTEFSRPDWEDPKYLDPYVAGVPLGRMAEPTDMIGAALLLASNASSYISGNTILVDGGGQA